MRQTLGHLEPMRCVQGMSVTTQNEDYEDYAHVNMFPKCVTSLLGFMLCFVLFFWILAFMLSLLSDASTFSKIFFHVNCISPRTRNTKCRVLLDVVVRLCPVIVNLYPKFLHISHHENGSFEVLSFSPRRLQ